MTAHSELSEARWMLEEEPGPLARTPFATGFQQINVPSQGILAAVPQQ